ncbi:copper amine oxidase [Paenibacillus crassostreae]|uniref:Copper amine oxidase n=1 Tax=Paenibacillus crassostreae TaxID=1763538 RepID=A0A167C6S8_9BACL|nr:copper amine oxidase [Paenibacillus crassostreae]AOZ91575.1 copper amine oxidase [Paenibacillus crassostreae]OAB72851.1 copper amine oxidase [Paenibacillus crassostreae]
MRWKKVVVSTLVLSLMGGSLLFADSVNNKVHFWVNGQEVQDGGYVIEGKTYVPLRAFEGLVNWDSVSNQVKFIKPNVHIFLFKGDTIFGNVNKGKLKFNVFSQVDNLSENIVSVKVAITDPAGTTKDIQSQDLDSDQKDNFWFRTDDFTYDFKTSGKYKIGFYIKYSENSDYELVSQKVITALD